MFEGRTEIDTEAERRKNLNIDSVNSILERKNLDIDVTPSSGEEDSRHLDFEEDTEADTRYGQEIKFMP